MTFVIKIGTSSLAEDIGEDRDGGINETLVRALAADIAALQEAMQERCIVVTSGAKMAARDLQARIFRDNHGEDMIPPENRGDFREAQPGSTLFDSLLDLGNQQLFYAWRKGFLQAIPPVTTMLLLDSGLSGPRYRHYFDNERLNASLDESPWDVRRCLRENVLPLVNGDDRLSETQQNND